MDTKKNSGRIVIFGMILLIVAGIIVVALKGFNVSLMFGKHERINIKLDVNADLNKVEEICKETFGKKDFVVKGLEVFGDSVQINVASITDEEKNTLIEKINEGFGIQKTVENLNIKSVSNKRIRDVVKPYIVPMIISYVIVFVYMLIRFSKINAVKQIINAIWKIALLEAILISAIAVTRMAVDDLLISVLVLVAVADLVYCVKEGERELAIKLDE